MAAKIAGKNKSEQKHVIYKHLHRSGGFLGIADCIFWSRTTKVCPTTTTHLTFGKGSYHHGEVANDGAELVSSR